MRMVRIILRQGNYKNVRKYPLYRRLTLGWMHTRWKAKKGLNKNFKEIEGLF